MGDFVEFRGNLKPSRQHVREGRFKQNKHLNVTLSDWSFVEVCALSHSADVALTSPGLWLEIKAESAVSTVSLPRWSQVLHGNTHFLLYISSLNSTDRSDTLTSVRGVVGL